MADPWKKLLGFDSLGGFGQAASAVPQVDPEEERSALATLGEQSLGGLSYLGKIADKTFGGRAIRGVLGGSARELLSVLPMSDTLGLTDERDVVTGRKLAQNLGLTGPGTPGSFDSGDALGIGIELALDPSTYLGFGTATRAGQIAAKTGNRFFGNTAAKIGGFAAREADVAAHALATGKTQLAAMADLGLGATDNLLSPAAEAAAQAANVTLNPRRAYSAAAGALEDVAGGATPLAGALGIGAPFGIGGRTAFLTGDAGKVVSGLLPYNLAASGGGKLSGLIEGQTGFNPLRSLKRNFNYESKGASTAAGQLLNETLTSPLEERLAADTLGETADLAQKLRPFQAQGPDAARLANRRNTILAEEANRTTATPYAPVASAYSERELPKIEQQLLAAGFTPAQIADLDAASTAAGRRLQRIVPGQQSLGVNASSLEDIAGYFTRQKEVLPRQPGESRLSYVVRKQQNYAARSPSTGRRDDVFRLVPGGTDQINSFARDPALVAQARAAPEQAARGILRQLLDNRGLTERVPFVSEKIEKRFVKSGQRLIDERTNKLLDIGPQLPSTLDAVPGQVRADLSRQTVRSVLRKQSRKLADLIGTIPDERAAAGLGYFSDDFLGGFRTALTRDARVRSAATAGLEGLAQNLVPHLGDDTTTRVSSLLNAMNLSGRRAGSGRQVAMDLLAERTGRSAKDLEKMGVPTAFAADLMRTNVPQTAPAEIGSARALWRAATQAFKTGVTTPFPAFHVRNLGDALFGQASDQAVSRAAWGEAYNLNRGGQLSAGQASKLYPGLAPAEATAAFERELLSRPVTNAAGGQTRDTIGKLGETVASNPAVFPEATGRSLGGDALAGSLGLLKGIPEAYTAARTAGKGRLGAGLAAAGQTLMAPVNAGAAVGDLVENQGRVSHYLALRNQGFSPAAAADRVSIVQRDYSRLTDTEKGMRDLIPFMGFSRRNATRLADEIGTAPGRLAGSLRVTQGGREPGEFVPPYIAEGASLPLGSNPDGSQRYLSSFGLPFEDDTVKSVGNLLHGDLSRAVQGTLGQTQAYLKAPLEFAFGRQLFSGRRLDELRPSAVLSAVLPETLARQTTQFVANTPAARLLSSADRLLDPRKGTGVSAMNLLTGARMTDVDTEAQRPVAQRRMIEEMLRGQPGIRQADTVYLKKDALDAGGVPDDVQRLYRYYLDLNKQIEANSKNRR